MLTENGSLQLQDFTDRNFQEAFTQVTEGVWHVSGLGHSNAVVLEGNTGVILIDTLDTLERGEKLLHFNPGKNGKRSENGNFHPFPSRSPGRRRRFSGKRSGDYCLRAENTGPGGLGIAAADSEQTGKQAVRLYPYGRRKYFPGNRPARGSRIWGAPRLYRAVNGLSGGQRETVK